MKRHWVLVAFIFPLLSACEPQLDNLKLMDQLVVSTNFDPEADFSEYVTYAIPKDTIGFVTNENPNDTIRIYSAAFQYPRKVIDKVKSNMNSFGYTQVDRTENPDVGVNIYVVSDLNLFQQVVYPNYYYPGYYGYGGYYYYPYVQTYAYHTATLIVELVDLKNRSGNNVKVVWNAYMGDVVSSVDYEQQSLDAIDQAFVQSDYLKNNE